MKRSDAGKNLAGFATLAAILIMGTVSVAVLMLSQLLAADAKRTIRESQGAQLRALLDAGARDAIDKMNNTGQAVQPYQLAVPEELSARVSISAPKLVRQDRAEIEIRAQQAGRSMAQTRGLIRQGDRWVVRSAQLSE